MRIEYDYQIYTAQIYGGISRYFYELVKELNMQDNVETVIPLLLSNNYYISEKEYTQHINLLPKKKIRGKIPFFKVVNKFNSIIKLKKQDFDIFHPTYYDPYFLEYIGKKPLIVTVHDMIHEKFPDIFSSTDKTSENKKKLIDKATKIIAISNSTKNDLVEIFGTDPKKIEVVYHGHSILESTKSMNVGMPSTYILFVGERKGYKNFEKFIKSVSELFIQNRSLFVVCAGGGEFNHDEIQLFLRLDILKQVCQYNVDDRTLSSLYKNAQLFVFPSLYEGFGIPILESFSSKCPLLCSNTSSFPEVAGDAAYYFDPYNKKSIKNAVIKVLENKRLQKKMIQKGLVQLKKFSWKDTAVKTKNIYESVMR